MVFMSHPDTMGTDPGIRCIFRQVLTPGRDFIRLLKGKGNARLFHMKRLEAGEAWRSSIYTSPESENMKVGKREDLSKERVRKEQMSILPFKFHLHDSSV